MATNNKAFRVRHGLDVNSNATIDTSGNANIAGNLTANTGFVSADTFRLDTTYTGGTSQPGEIAWDVDEGTVMFQLKDGAVTHRIGQQLDIRVVNNTGSTIPEGAVVYINGSSGQEPTIALANAATEGASSKTIGVVTHQGGIANAASGYICISGIMRGVDVGAYTAGTPLWLSNVAGVFIDTKPTPPENGVFIGWVVKAGNAGSILVAIQNGYEVNELHDVLYTSLAQNDILQRNSANTLWVNKTLAGANIANLAATGSQTFSGPIVVTGNVNATTFNGSGAGLTSIPNDATTANSANGASTIVARDANGSFSANIITASLTGTASFATTANAVAVGNITGLGTNVATFLGTPNSLNLLNTITDETGTGSVVFATSPQLTTPNIGAATGTSLNVTGQLISTQANGTAPLAVSSTTKVANLNADLLDGYDTATANTASTVVVRDAGGNIAANTVNAVTVNATTNVVTVTVNATTVNVTGQVIANTTVGATSVNTGFAHVPTGAIVMWTTDTIPNGWLLCNGATYANSSYQALASVIGTTYGGNATHFVVPNLLSRVVVGKDTGDVDWNNIGETGGSKSSAHTHTLSDVAWAQVDRQAGRIEIREVTADQWTATASVTGTGATSTNTATQGAALDGVTDSTSSSTVQPYIALNYIIKT